MFITTGIIAFLIILALLFSNSFIQTILAKNVASYYSKKLNTHIDISKLEISIRKKLIVRDLLILDQQNDTLLSTHSFTIKLDWFDFQQMKFIINSIELDAAVIKVAKMDEQSNFSFIVNYFEKQPSPKTVQHDSIPIEKLPPKIRLKGIDIRNSSFSYYDQNNKRDNYQGIDFADLTIRNINLKAINFSLNGDTLLTKIDSLSFYETGGFTVNQLSGDIAFSPIMIKADSLKVITTDNNLDMDLLFSYKGMADFQNFIDDVKIKADFRPSTINLTEVGYFAPLMYSMDNQIKLRGNINGYVSNFKAKNLRFAVGNSTHFQGDIRMNGLPEVKETFAHLSIDQLITSTQDVTHFKLPGDDTRIVIPEQLMPFGNINIHGKFTGFYNDFVSYADFDTDIGYIATDVMLKVDTNEEISYLGRIETDNFNAGVLFNAENTIGTFDLVADIVGSGLTFETADIRMDGVIDSLDLLNNIYNTVHIYGQLAEQKFVGKMIVKDDKINLDFDGSIDYGGIIPAYNFTASVENAHLYDINLYPRDSSAILSTILKFNFMGDEPDQMQGVIKLDSTKFYESGEYYSLESLFLTVTRNSSDYAVISLFSDIIDASIEGEMTIRNLPQSINRFGHRYLPAFFPLIDTIDYSVSTQNFVFDLDLKNTEPLSRMFIPELKLSNNTKLKGIFDNLTNTLSIAGNADKIEYNGQIINNWQFKTNTLKNKLLVNTSCDEFFLSDTISVVRPKIICSAKNDSIGLSFMWGDTLVNSNSYGNINSEFNITSPERYNFYFNKSEMNISGIHWAIDTANFVEIDSSSILIKDMIIKSNQQKLIAHGKISENIYDTMFVGFKDFNLSNTDLFLKNVSVDLDGWLDGNIKLIDLYNSPTYLVDATIDSLYLNKEKLGDAIIKTNWDPKSESFDVLGEIIYTGNIGSSKTLEVSGFYFPYRKNENFDINILLKNYKLKTLEPFLRSFTSKVDGNASGEVSLTGSKQKPYFKGEVNVKHVSMLIDYINVVYNFADKISFDDRSMYFNNLTIYDSLNNQANCKGKIVFNNINDIELDLNFKTDKIAGLNTTRANNELFYGKAHATGDIRIAGPVSNLKMSIAVKTERGTNVFIPISYGSSVSDNDYIVFLNPNKTEKEEKNTELYKVSTGGMEIEMDLEITQDADLQIFLPYQMGNIRGRGNGAIKLDVTSDLDFRMNGEYKIAKGSFFFTLRNIINRNFEITRGSKISWSGNPYNAIIDMNAIYRVKTKLGDFGPPEDSASRVNVDCIIGLKNSLLDPQIIFTIDFPDLKDSEKQYIYSRLDTTDQDMMSQQMLSLLVLNSFSSNTGTGGSVGFNTYSLLTNQINNWLSQISNDFDIGVNYLPGDELSAQEVEVVLSTQLWDDRVLIDGNVGMRGSETAQKTNEIVGEVNVEVMITPDGRLRAKAFNKSNDEYLYRNYSPYTQGVGIFYTKEFNYFKDLFERKEKKKKQNIPSSDIQE